MRKSDILFSTDQATMKSDAFIEFCRSGNPNVFVRKRKMPLDDLLLSMINRKGLTLKLELRNYMKITHPGIKISKPAYLKQRMKLNPEAFKYLYQSHNANFYHDDEITPYTYKGFLVLAADGSDINIPTTPETLEKYGDASRSSGKPCAQLGLGCLYDVLNRFILDSAINRSKFDEISIALSQIDRVRETIGEKYPFMVIMDRGYPSIPAFLHMIDSGVFFVVRLKSIDYKAEQKALSSNDEDVTIKLTRDRRHTYYGTEKEEIVMSRDSFPLRMVTVTLEDGKSKVLATNLPRDLFPQECFQELYDMRWGIESAFQTLKDRLQMENFTGTKPILLEQDINSTIYVSNLAEDIICDVEEQQSGHLKTDYKHTMKINRNVSIGLLKSDLIYIVLESDLEKKTQLMQNLYKEISENIVPIRPGRHYHRTKSNLANDYSNTHKRSF